MNVLNKLFPPPSTGTSRIIPSRHPVQVSLMLALIVSSTFQWFLGPVDVSVWSEVPSGLFSVILIGFITGASLCLLASVFAEKNPWNSLGFSLGGFTILTMLMFLSIGVYMQVPGYIALNNFWTTTFLTVGFAVRCAQLAVDAVRIWRHKEGRHE